MGLRPRPKRRARPLAGYHRPVPEDCRPKIALEAAALVGVVVAVIAGSFYAFGTVSHLAYFEALGFDGHQFPTVGSELHLSGAVYVVLPALFLGVFALFFACVFALSNRVYDNVIIELIRRPFPKWRIILLVLLVIYAASVVVTFLAGTLTQYIVTTVCFAIIIGSAILLGIWVLPAAACCYIGALAFLLVMQYVTAQAYEAGNARASEAGKSHASTIVELADRSKITVPGVRVICSERFCGFHDGKTATVISLEGVLSIQSPVPQEQPSPPTTERRGFWRRLFGE